MSKCHKRIKSDPITKGYELILPHVDVVISDNGWTALKENKLLEWKQKCIIYSWAHAKSQEYYKKYLLGINVVAISFVVLSCIFSIISIKNGNIFAILATITSAISAFISAFIQSYSPSDTASSHEQVSRSYTRITALIDLQLVNAQNERTEANVFLQNIQEQMTELSIGGPIVPIALWHSITKMYESGELDIDKITPVRNKEPLLVELWRRKSKEVRGSNDNVIINMTESKAVANMTARMMAFQLTRFG